MQFSLTPEELKKFNEQGFIGPFKLYEEDEAKEILRQIRIKSADMTNALFQNTLNYDRHYDIQELSNHICHPGIVGRLQSIMGEEILLWRTEYFPKYPGSKGTEWHQVQDYSYATGKPQLVPTNKAPGIPMELTVWTCFTDSVVENGCMKFMPGSHNKMYYDESKTPTVGREGHYKADESETGFYGYNFSDFKVDPNWEPDEEKAVTMEMKPGECVIFSARTMHASHPNTSERSTRFAITGRYSQGHVRVYPDTDEYTAHGSTFDLSNWGCIQVSGQDSYHHNKFRSENNLGVPFPVLTPAEAAE